MAVSFTSARHVFSVLDVVGSTDGGSADINFAAAASDLFIDKSNNTLFPVDSTFGFYVQDFIGAEDKVFDGDYAEGWVGNLEFGFPDDPDPLPPGWVSIEDGLGVRNARTDIFLTGAPLGTWQVAMGGQSPVKASTEHYATMASLLSDQAYPDDPDALRQLDNDLRVLDYDVDEVSQDKTFNDLHLLWLSELTDAMQNAIDYVGAGTSAPTDDVRNDIDFDRDGTPDAYRITTQAVDYEGEPRFIAAVDIGDNGSIDMEDGLLNGYGGTADITDILEPNEASVTSDIAFGQDYSITVKDDGKLLYRWGEAVKRPNDVRMEVNLDLPEEWTADANNNSVMDGLELGGFTVTRAELVIRHDITNNPNDQVRPEDYENEGAIGRLPAHYIIRDPDDASNILWVSPVDSYTGRGEFLPSYLVLDNDGNVVNTEAAPANSTAVFDPDGQRVGYRNDLVEGTILKDESLIALNEAAGLDFSSADLTEGFTSAWYTTVNREPFEWSYDTDASPYINVYESFRSHEEAEDAGYTMDDLESGPRWRLTPNKFGQDLPGLEVPVEENSQPPYQKANIKYPTGEFTTTTLNLLDWEGDSPLSSSVGWMAVDPERVDENADGLIDEGWTNVNGSLGAGDALPDLILTATSPNGVNMEAEFLDTAVYVKGDRQDDARLYDVQLILEYGPPSSELIGAVQEVSGFDHTGTTVSFQDGSVFDNPVVFLPSLSLKGEQTANVAVTSVSATDASVYVREPNYLDGSHKGEDATMITMEEGVWELSDGTRIEVGTQDVGIGPKKEWISVSFDGSFDDVPIVLVQLQTANDPDWTVVRVDNVTTDGFDFALFEEKANVNFNEAAEVLGWMALDAADGSGLINADGMIAQAFFEAQEVDHNSGSVALDAALGLDPLVAGQISSFFGGQPATTRLVSVSNDGVSATANFIAQEENSSGNNDLWHVAEDINGLAFSDAGLLTGISAHDGLAIV